LITFSPAAAASASYLTPDDSGKPRGLTEGEFIQVMRQGQLGDASGPALAAPGEAAR
jgi:hypothetical protein